MQKITTLVKSMHFVFHKYPKLSNYLAGFATFSAGDFIAQNLDREKKRKVNYLRSIEIGMLGLFLNGFLLVRWYHLLEHMFGSSMNNAKSVILKCIADQVVFAPASIILFFSFSSYIQEYSIWKATKGFEEKMKENFFTTYAADCTLWPFANFLNFRMIPLPYRPSFTSFIQFMWQIYLSFVSIPHQEVDDI